MRIAHCVACRSVRALGVKSAVSLRDGAGMDVCIQLCTGENRWSFSEGELLGSVRTRRIFPGTRAAVEQPSLAISCAVRSPLECFFVVAVTLWYVYGAALQVRNEFYKDSQGGLLVFDASSRASFENLVQWVSWHFLPKIEFLLSSVL